MRGRLQTRSPQNPTHHSDNLKQSSLASIELDLSNQSCYMARLNDSKLFLDDTWQSFIENWIKNI